MIGVDGRRESVKSVLLVQVHDEDGSLLELFDCDFKNE